jgi:ribose/xylose/arabinose/galactoside ABC-type transport system permease subunit
MSLSEILKNPNFIITLAVFFTACGSAGFVIWKEQRPRDSLTPSMIPPVPVMLFSGIVALLSLVHLVNLLGVHTGR